MGYAAKDSSDHQHKELQPQEIFNLFKEKFEDITTPFNISEVHFKQHNGIIAEVTVECEGKSVVAIAAGNGRLNAVSNALKNQFRLEYDLTTYQEHALEQSSSLSEFSIHKPKQFFQAASHRFLIFFSHWIFLPNGIEKQIFL